MRRIVRFGIKAITVCIKDFEIVRPSFITTGVIFPQDGTMTTEHLTGLNWTVHLSQFYHRALVSWSPDRNPMLITGLIRSTVALNLRSHWIWSLQGFEELLLNHEGGNPAVFQWYVEPRFIQAWPEHLQHGLPGSASDSAAGCALHICAGVLSLLLLSSCRWMSVLSRQRRDLSHKCEVRKEEEKEKRQPEQWRLVDLSQNRSHE